MTTPPHHVLFIGNSYTQNNRLPDVVAQLAKAAGHALSTRLHATGGNTLARHANNPNTLELINSQHWDAVVLQEQSIIPAVESERPVMYQAIRYLDWHIKQAGSTTLLLQTWGRQHGLADFGFSDYATMQAHLDIGYREIASEVGATLIPVGRVWQQVVNRYPNIALWGADGGHPAKAGTYLAACVCFVHLYGESPEGLVDTFGLGIDTARRLQAVASESVQPDYRILPAHPTH